MPTLRKLTKLIHRRSLWTPLPFRGENSVSTTFLLSDFQSAAESKDGQECRSTHSAKLTPACGLTGPDEASDERTSPTAVPGRPAHPSKPPRNEASPLPKKKKLLACRISGGDTYREVPPTVQPPFRRAPGDRQPKQRITPIFKSGKLCSRTRHSKYVSFGRTGCKFL